MKPKEYISKDYYQLQTMLSQMPGDNLRAWCTALQQASFWSQRPGEDKAMEKFLCGLVVTGDNPDKLRGNSAEDLSVAIPPACIVNLPIISEKNKTKPMKKILFLFLSILTVAISHAQTKVFKEVGEEMSTQFKAITQDNALVGYLSFTKLEKTSEDSFNYRITVMDENLNDIGKLNFRQENLYLQDASFEQNILCLGYIKSPLVGLVSHKEARKLKKKEDATNIMVQFISLNGMIVNTFSKPVELTTGMVAASYWSMKETGTLKHHIQISNMAKTGFSLFYGDEKKNEILLFDTRGNMIHQKVVTADAQEFQMLTSGPNVYLLTQKDVPVYKSNSSFTLEGGYTVYIYNANEPAAEHKYALTDAHGNSLKVLTFDNDPVTGRAYLAGCVINPSRQKDFLTAHDLVHNQYIGVFTLDLGNTDKDVKTTYSYWDKEAIPGIKKDGLFTDKKFYVNYHSAFRDFSGNTVFAGSAMEEKTVLGPPKYRITDGVFVRQDGQGSLKLDNNVPGDVSSWFPPFSLVGNRDRKGFYKIVNSDTKTLYVIIDDEDNTYIYNVNSKKVMRTIPHKDGNIKTRVFPAKEGHVMISVYNNKEKSTRVSIEVL